jgi:SAM-dependent methyltransferase
MTLHEFPYTSINLNRLPVSDRILDIGGGGEGVIGQLMGDQVVAIDRSRAELEEAPQGGLKIVMDAVELKFLDGTFSAVSFFYSLMYVPHEFHKRIFEEVFRVLKPGGFIYLWDVNLSECVDPNKDGFCVFLKIKLPDREIQTGYAARWPLVAHDFQYYSNLCELTGFEIVSGQHKDFHFALTALKKP